MSTETFVKDIKPGLKNLNLIFIVLETGGCPPQPPASTPRLPPGAPSPDPDPLPPTKKKAV